jgi:phosphate transport system permease protein
MRFFMMCANAIALLIFLGLLLKSWPILSENSLAGMLLSSSWHPSRGDFGFLPFIVGTIEVTVIAMVLAIPVCLLSAIYLSEYAHKRLRESARHVIDIMAAIPSVIYGLWGVIVIVPLIRTIGKIIDVQTTGYCLLAGGVILAIMVTPIMISVMIEVFRVVPMDLRESALSLGATKWETVKHVILRRSRHGILSAVILGFARVFGETIAVLMVVGNVARIPHSLFDPAYPLPALIANNYGEMMSIPLYDSALMLAALILFLLVGGFNYISHLMLKRMEIQL